jgi:muramoyltetrapeptide carboxypeptidase
MFHRLSLPPFLKPGDLVKVIAPSGALREVEAFEGGLDIWRSRGYRVELGSNWNERHGYLAGTDSQRRQALAQAWQDPDCKAILCVRGGYGRARLLENWRWEDGEMGGWGDGERGRWGDGEDGGDKEKRGQGDKRIGELGQVANPKSKIQNPKWIVGFSDVTGLLWSLANAGIAGIHGPVLTTLADEPQWSIGRLFDALEGRSLAPLIGEGWGGGITTGRLLPANLTVATHLLGTFLQPSLEGVILALEDVTEAPYRIDRLLTQWRMMGALRGVKGIALGRFSRCESPAGIASWSVEEVLRDRLGNLAIPIVANLPFGHDGVNAALPVGAMVGLNAHTGLLEILPEVISSPVE